jgi:hypothetical protein
MLQDSFVIVGRSLLSVIRESSMNDTSSAPQIFRVGSIKDVGKIMLLEEEITRLKHNLDEAFASARFQEARAKKAEELCEKAMALIQKWEDWSK